MAKLTLTMLDTNGIQKYIFNSNRLQENIGIHPMSARALNQEEVICRNTI